MGQSGPWVLCTIKGVRILVEDLRHRLCVFALQETDNWKVREIDVPGYVCYGWDEGRTAIFVPQTGLPGTSLV